jgi:hypothetical protein
LTSEAIGLIEVDAGPLALGWGSLSRVTLPKQFCPRTSGGTNRMAFDAVCPTEFIAGDAQQLMSDLEAEFNRLRQRLRAK